MTMQQAHKRAVALIGKRARVEVRPNAGRIGHHGEYVKAHLVNRRDGSLKEGRYLCKACSTLTVDENGDVIDRDVWHLAGGVHISYVVGFVDSHLGFYHLKAEGGSWAECFAQLEEAKR